MLDTRHSLADRIDVVESSYEFMLAYAAQGRNGTEGGPSDEICDYLRGTIVALDGLTDACRNAAAGENDNAVAALDAFLEVLDRDIAKAVAALRLVEVQPAISSQMIDNLNASIHLRALLTDLFLLDGTVSKQPEP